MGGALTVLYGITLFLEKIKLVKYFHSGILNRSPQAMSTELFC